MIDGKAFLDAVEDGLNARAAFRKDRHTDREEQRVKAAEDRLTAFLNPQTPEAPDAHETEV